MVRFLSILKERYPEIVADYWSEYNKREADSRCGQSPLINRAYISDDPELEPHLKQLEELGF